jgi:hypothetical protein
MTKTVHYWRIVAFLLGAVATAIGCYGAYEYALKLEGGQISYLVIAGPVVAASASIIPGFAEAMWRQRHIIKALLWWVVLIPAGAVVFYSAAERVHHAKAGSQAQRSALSSAAQRAQEDLEAAKATALKAQAEADKTKLWKNCATQCLGIRQIALDRAQGVAQAETRLLASQAKATQESPLEAPVWLLPAALDLVGFMALWTALAGPWIERHHSPSSPVAVRARVKVKRKAPQPKGPEATRLRVVPRLAANDRT